MPKYILSIDQGTTSSRAVLFDDKAKVIGTAQQEFKQHFPHNGWVEHNPDDIWQTVLTTCKQVIAEQGISASDIASIGITNQRETTLVWDRYTGETIYPAIVWQDRRTDDLCQQLISEGKAELIQQKTGLLLDAYFSATKVKWILDHVPNARVKAEKGELAFGTVDCFLLWKLSGGKSHKTDATNASRTLLFNIHNQTWDKALLTLFSIPESLLPEVLDCAADFGVTEAALMGSEIPILGIAGDQHAALFGQTCFEKGMIKSTYGTGCFMMLNTGDNALTSKNKLLTTVAYRLNGKVTYALEGSIFMAGATIQWLRDGLRLFKHAQETEQLASQIAYDHGVMLVPAFTGLGAPYWDANARGAILGLTRDSGIEEIVSAALQSVAFQTKDLQIAMEKDGIKPERIRVDGGMVANNWLMQCLADVLGVEIKRSQFLETTALGVAYLAGLHAGVFTSLDQIKSLWQIQQSFQPQITNEQSHVLYQQWQKAVERVLSEHKTADMIE